MSALETVLKLRPSSVAHQLADTTVCLLNARDVQRSHGSHLVVACEALAAPVAVGILRAARQLGAAVGLSFPALPRGEEPRAHAAFQALIGAAQESFYELPFFLRAGPVVIRETTEDAIAEAREGVFRLVDAGFTEVALEVSGLDPAEASAAVAEASLSLRERELSIEVATRDADPDTVAELLGNLGAQGVRTDVVSLPGAVMDKFEDLSAFVEIASPAALAIVDAGRNLVGSGARRMVASARFTRLVAAALGEQARASIRERALAGGSVPAAIAVAYAAARLDPGAVLKLEALAYNEALELLTAADAKGRGRTGLAYLAERSSD